MSTELEDLKQRVVQLERHFDVLEYRVNLREPRLDIVPRRPGPEPAGDASQDAELSQDPRLAGVESMLRSVLLHQHDHTSDLRRAVRYLQELVTRRSS